MSDTDNDSARQGGVVTRTRPLNLNDEELDYLWEMVKREIGKDEVWERGDAEIVESIHTKVHDLKGLGEEYE